MEKLSKGQKAIMAVMVGAYILGLLIIFRGREIYQKSLRVFINDDNKYCQFSYPNLEIDIPCFWAEDSTQLQKYVDAKDCAAISSSLIWLGYVEENESKAAFIIADHDYQGFDIIKQAQIGDIAVLTYPDGTKVDYRTIDCFAGHNEKDNLTDEYGNTILTSNPGGLILYTCDDNTGYNIWIVLLAPVEK